MKRIISVLLSIMMLLTPIIGSAESASDGYYFFSISDPDLSIPMDDGSFDINLEGLEMLFAAQTTEEAFDLLIGILGNGKEALTGALTIDETGLYAIVDGMENSATIPMAAIEELLTEVMSELESAFADMDMNITLEDNSSLGLIGGADGPTSIVVAGEANAFAEGFSEEALAEFMTALEAFMGSIEMSEPMDDTMYVGEEERAAQWVEFAVGTEALAGFFKAAGDLLMTNEEFAAGYRTALEEEDVEYMPLGDMVEQGITEAELSVEGLIGMSEEGDAEVYSTVYFADGEGEQLAIDMEFSYTQDDEGEYVYASIWPDETASIDLFISLMASTEFEGEIDFYAELAMYEVNETEEEIEVNEVASCELIVCPYLDEDGVRNNLCDLTITVEDETINLSLNTYGDEAEHGGMFCFMADTADFDGEFYLGYDGARSDDGLVEAGQIWAEAYDYSQSEDALMTFTCNIAYGQDVSGESIAYDFGAVPAIDITTADDATVEALGQDLLMSAMNGLQILGEEVPIIGMVLGLSGMEG